MNAKKWWAVPLIVVGVLGAVAAISIELTSGYPMDGRMLVAIAWSLGLNPVVWVGVGGVFLWYSGSKEAKAASPRSPGGDAPSGTATSGESSIPTAPIPPPATATSPGAATQPTGQSRTAQGWLLGLGAVALVGCGLLAGWFLFGGTESAGQAVASAESTLSTAPTGTSTSTSTTSTSTTVARAPLAEPTWELVDFDGSVPPEGSISKVPDEWLSLEWQTGSPPGPLTIDGTPGFLRAFHYYFLEDWRLFGLASNDQFAWTVMDTLGPTQGVLRYSLDPGESVGSCWSVDYDALVVVVVETDSQQKATKVARAWTYPMPNTWTWLGLDPALIDPSDVEPLGGGGDSFRDC